MNVQHVSLLQAPFTQDLENILSQFIDKWIFQTLERVESQPLRFEVFWMIWNELDFQIVHDCSPKKMKTGHFLQQLFQTVLLFFEQPNLLSLPNKTQQLEKLVEEAQVVVQVGCIYLLYLLYVTQQQSEETEKIRVALNFWRKMVCWIPFGLSQIRHDGRLQAVKICRWLVKEKAFRICYYPFPIEAPNTLFLPLTPFQICKYDVGEKIKANESKKSIEREHLPETSDNSNDCDSPKLTSLLLARFELQRTQEYWKKSDAIRKIIVDRLENVGRTSIVETDSFKTRLSSLVAQVDNAIKKMTPKAQRACHQLDFPDREEKKLKRTRLDSEV